MTFGSGEFRNPPSGVVRLARRMAELGVKPELEIYDTGHLDACLRLRDAGHLSDAPLAFSIVLGVKGGMAATADNLITMVRRLPPDCVLAGDRHRPGQPGVDRDRPRPGR